MVRDRFLYVWLVFGQDTLDETARIWFWLREAIHGMMGLGHLPFTADDHQGRAMAFHPSFFFFLLHLITE